MWKRFLFAKKKHHDAKRRQRGSTKHSERTLETDCSLTEWVSEFCMIRFDNLPPTIHEYTAATSLVDKEELYYSRTDYEEFQSERTARVDDVLRQEDPFLQALENLLDKEQGSNTIDPSVLSIIAQSTLRGYESILSRSLQHQRLKTIESVLELQQTTQDAHLLRSASRIWSSTPRSFAYKLAQSDAQVSDEQLA